MVFVNSDFQKSEFKSFDIPFAYVYDEKFNQPIFGSNYLSGLFLFETKLNYFIIFERKNKTSV